MGSCEYEFARFPVQVLSAENFSWQGVVKTDTDSFQFKSELELLKWVCQQYPELCPKLK